MTTKNREMELAYVLGMVNGARSKTNGRIKLGVICDEWSKYYIVCTGSEELNGTWWLKYDGPHGVRETYATIMTLDEGWSTSHMVHLITQAIQCHMKETKEMKEVEKTA